MTFTKNLSPLNHHNFRLYFFGEAVSLIGNWIAYMAEGWLITVLAKGNQTVANNYLSLMYTSGTVPSLLGALFTGSFADRYSPRKILIVAVTCQLILMLIFAGLVFSHQIVLWHIILLVVLLGVTSVFEYPAFDALYPHLLPESEFPQAGALTSNINQLARLLGPAIGGLFARVFTGPQEMRGIAQCLLFDALSYIPVLIAFLLLKVTIPPPAESLGDAKPPSILAHIGEGFQILRKNNLVAAFILLNAIYPLLCAPYINLIASYLRFDRKLGGDAYGTILSVQGIGALFASLLGTIYITKIKNKGRLVFVFYLIHYLLVMALTRSTSLALIAPLAVAGAVFYNWAGTLRGALYQQVVPREARGRMAGINQMLFYGLVPLGSAWSVIVADRASSGLSIFIGAALSITALVVIAFVLPNFLKSDSALIAAVPEKTTPPTQ